MTQKLCDVEEVSCAAAQIQNLTGTRHVELKLADPADVNSNPAVEIQIFWPVGPGICDSVSLTNLSKSGRIDCFDDSLCIK